MFIVCGLVVQPDGKIVLGGTSQNSGNPNFALIRYQTNGTLDSFFGDNGKTIVDIFGESEFGHSMVLLPDGRLVAAGTDGVFTGDFAVARYTVLTMHLQRKTK